MLRLAGEGTSDYIDRTAEEHNARVAAAAGVNAEVLYFDARDGTMVTRFIEGVSMNAGEGFGRDPGAPVRAARALGRVHRLGRVFRSRFDVFAAIDGYLGLLREQADAAARGLPRGGAEGAGRCAGRWRPLPSPSCPATTTRGRGTSSTRTGASTSSTGSTPA